MHIFLLDFINQINAYIFVTRAIIVFTICMFQNLGSSSYFLVFDLVTGSSKGNTVWIPIAYKLTLFWITAECKN